MLALGLLLAAQADTLTFEDPSFSPDGRRIACVAGIGPEGGRITRREIWTMNLDGSDSQVIVSEGFNFRPVWSPDGKTIAFERQTSGTRHDLFTVASTGGSEKQITTTTGLSESEAVFSADGKNLFCLREEGIPQPSELVRVFLADGKAETLLGTEWDVQDVDVLTGDRLAVVLKRMEKNRPAAKFREDYVSAWFDVRGKRLSPLLAYPADQEMTIYGVRAFTNGEAAVMVGKSVSQGIFIYRKNGQMEQISGARPLYAMAFTKDGSKLALPMNRAGKWGIYLWTRNSDEWSTVKLNGPRE